VPKEFSRSEEEMNRNLGLAKAVMGAALLLGLLMTSLTGLARDKNETIEATAFGRGHNWERTLA
jgi:hypothetical protein